MSCYIGTLKTIMYNVILVILGIIALVIFGAAVYATLEMYRLVEESRRSMAYDSFDEFEDRDDPFATLAPKQEVIKFTDPVLMWQWLADNVSNPAQRGQMMYEAQSHYDRNGKCYKFTVVS
jgi:hypothetical protein